MSNDDTKKTAAEMVVQLETELQTALKEGRWADSEGLDNQLREYRRTAELDELKAERDKYFTALQRAESSMCSEGIMQEEDRTTPWSDEVTFEQFLVDQGVMDIDDREEFYQSLDRKPEDLELPRRWKRLVIADAMEAKQ